MLTFLADRTSLFLLSALGWIIVHVGVLVVVLLNSTRSSGGGKTSASNRRESLHGSLAFDLHPRGLRREARDGSAFNTEFAENSEEKPAKPSEQESGGMPTTMQSHKRSRERKRRSSSAAEPSNGPLFGMKRSYAAADSDVRSSDCLASSHRASCCLVLLAT